MSERNSSTKKRSSLEEDGHAASHKKRKEEPAHASSSKKAKYEYPELTYDDEEVAGWEDEYEHEEPSLKAQVKEKEKEKAPAQAQAESQVQKNGSKANRSSDGPVRVYADGIYDLFHFGHARSLEQAKKLFPNTYLLVGVCNDELTHRLKGKTVMNDRERAESIRHCKWVDEVVENAPWIVTQDFIDKHQIDFVAHGQDIILDENGVDIYKFVKDQGKYRVINRTEGISTSDIILRIVKDYDSYVRRNLARGYTGKQMGISYVKEKQLQMEENIKKFTEKMQDRYKKVQNWSKSRRIFDFLKKFGERVEKLVTIEEGGEGGNDYSSDDQSGFSSPDHSFSSPDTVYHDYSAEEEKPPHV